MLFVNQSTISDDQVNQLKATLEHDSNTLTGGSLNEALEDEVDDSVDASHSLCTEG